MTSTKRNDGRVDDQMRPIRIEPDVLDYAEGSVMISVGKTRVLCAATVEEKLPSFRKESGLGWVTAEYSLLPRSTHTRNTRESMLLALFCHFSITFSVIFFGLPTGTAAEELQGTLIGTAIQVLVAITIVASTGTGMMQLVRATRASQKT